MNDMLTGSTVFPASDVDYEDIEGYPAGHAAIAELVGTSRARGLRVGLIRMHDVEIPRGERGEEALFVVSGEVVVEEDGRRTRAVAGDTIFLAEGAAPTYTWTEDTVIFYALTPPSA